MATKSEQVQALNERFNAATNEVAADLQTLRDKIKDGTVSDADVAALEANIARLEGMGADPVPEGQ